MIEGDAYTIGHGEYLYTILPETYEREGYNFVGWTNGKDPIDPNDRVTSEMTIEAQLEIKKYTVKFDDIIYEVEHGAKVPKPPDPVRAGWIFNGWCICDTPFNFNSIITSDLIITSSWTSMDGGDEPPPIPTQ